MRGISVFDLDQTLVTCNSSYGYCAFLNTQRVLSKFDLWKALWFRLRLDFSSASISQLHEQLFKSLLQGISMNVLEDHVEPYLEQSLLHKIYFPAFQELRLAQHCGHYTVIMSSSPSFIVRRIAEQFGVNEWLATEYHLDEAQCLTGVRKFIDGEDKAEALRQLIKDKGIAREKVAVYSDSYRDLPLLLVAGEPVAVNPDAKLHKLCRRNKWRIL